MESFKLRVTLRSKLYNILPKVICIIRQMKKYKSISGCDT